MSFHRENVIWPCPDETWNLAFYACEEQSWKDDPDPEWDVEYDFGTFEWVSRGHQNMEAARASWRGSNPGGYTIVNNLDDPDIPRLEEMVTRFLAR
jgi:hypothetical protein